MSSNARKSAILGMAHGTAIHRLRKMIVLHLARQLGQDECFKCRGIIASEAELSIEHKRPWESAKSPGLFWDLSNIAFSHLKCNRPHHLTGNRKVGPDGTHWCCTCQAFLPTANFGPADNWKGAQDRCRNCLRDLMRTIRAERADLGIAQAS